MTLQTLALPLSHTAQVLVLCRGKTFHPCDKENRFVRQEEAREPAPLQRAMNELTMNLSQEKGRHL